MTRSTRAFFLTALLALPAAAALHLLALLGVGSTWAAMVHLTVFGWITMVIVAVNYHTMPVFAARDFPAPRLIWAHWMLVTTGVVFATIGVLAGWGRLITTGYVLQLAAALVFIANIVLLFRRGARRPQRAPLPPIVNQRQVDRVGTSATKAAGIALVLALLLLSVQRMGWIAGAWVLAAEHMATLGWVMLMIVGVAYHVLPRFSAIGTRGPGWGRAQLLCHLSALTLMVPALGFAWTWVFVAGALLMTTALGLFAWTVWPAVRIIRSAGDITHRGHNATPRAIHGVAARCVGTKEHYE